MVTPFNMRQLYGDVAETATIVRELLEPVATQLSGDLSTVHRRCVFGRHLSDSHPDGVRDDLAPFGSIEAVALGWFVGVIVFRDEASVAVALRRQGETRAGWFSAVPALDAALPLRYFTPQARIKVALYPQTPADTARTQAPPRQRKRPTCTFSNTPHENYMPDPYGEEKKENYAGTTKFVPSKKALIYGPVLGVDGHLWMEGHNDIYYDHGVVRTGPSWIRVAPLEPLGAYGSNLPEFVPLFSVGI